MPADITPPIRIASALIDDGAGRMLLVRKRGSRFFMLAGGKIEPGESPEAALLRELREEIGLVPDPRAPRYLGSFTAEAANEPGRRVEAELYHLRIAPSLAHPRAEIAEARWLTESQARSLPLANLARDHVLPIFESLLRADAG
ncbi:NUDIX hydrolase [Sphingosinithalassobacter portus]|uniref:NUDIX hydrolase n=1 Tax=Stakelama portus TaxID=2676234 RepID=UPI000D6E5E5D|nr:NUDIX domain-containing protein [Sphingosinithalassobacter portus]